MGGGFIAKAGVVPQNLWPTGRRIGLDYRILGGNVTV